MPVGSPSVDIANAVGEERLRMLQGKQCSMCNVHTAQSPTMHTLPYERV